LNAPHGQDEVPNDKKVVFVLVLTARWMRYYFQNHTITVKTDYAISAKLTSQQDLLAGWTVYADGSSNKAACGAGVVLEGSGDLLLEQALKLRFKDTNNQVEYEAILVGLHLAYDMVAHEVTCKSDSQLVVGQIK